MSYNVHGIRLEFVVYFVHSREKPSAERDAFESSRNAKFLVKGRQGGGWGWFEGEGRGRGREKINGKRTGCSTAAATLLFYFSPAFSLLLLSSLPPARSLCLPLFVFLPDRLLAVCALFPPPYAFLFAR